ncbi:2Fe-2S ferredoxin [Lipingzhangella halophila]|uniref:2Fe-2S ferredoxin n=1 Tax=Lipingzhangella halophila TaxID=1783352 RepID=A0A7W7RJI3_9ACTN|nr:2Fe-2S iron-sulfur cluster-binding protein [Lipingzhangella halophila]MBB4932738.1 2Fe-2S ferredoxin [Lipingzhangella halophila]
MPKIIYNHADGTHDVVDAPAGTSVMRAAVTGGVAGIVGECGGQAMCATCHVYVRPERLAGLPAVSEDEDEMLDCAAAGRDSERSRLGCQLFAGEAFDEIEVDVPESQS